MNENLDPKEFEDTAEAVIAACSNETEPSIRSRLLAEAGLLGVIAPEAVGGLGLPLDFAVPIAMAAGAGLLAFPLIETILLANYLADIDADLAQEIVAGETLVTIAWSGNAASTVAGNAPMANLVDRIMIMQGDGTGKLVQVDDAAMPQVASEYDLEIPNCSVHLDSTVNGIAMDAQTVAALRQDAKILRAAHICGSSARCLKLASEYSQERVQFRKPLSAYQGLRHRMSRDALVIETLKNGISRALRVRDDGNGIASDAVWLTAARQGPAVAESAIQIFGGMGFTWEVPLHRHLRQMHAQSQYGDAPADHEAIGDALLASVNNEWYGDITHDV